jgi:hypothetical protein
VVTPDQVAAFVAATCAAQGIAVKVTDPGAIRDVVTLLGGARGPSRAGTRSARAVGTRDRLEQPHRTDPGLVEASAPVTGLDDDVIDDRSDNGDLLAQGERRPA